MFLIKNKKKIKNKSIKILKLFVILFITKLLFKIYIGFELLIKNKKKKKNIYTLIFKDFLLLFSNNNKKINKIKHNKKHSKNKNFKWFKLKEKSPDSWKLELNQIYGI